MGQTLVLLAAFIVFAALFVRLRLGTILGFLVGGTLIGPHGVAVVTDLDAVAHLAELGVVFLLFNLGLELKLERLRLFGSRVYLLALTQLGVTAIAIAAVAYGFGLTIEGAVVLGGGLALSSTAVVIQVLGDLGRTLTQLGRVAIAILLVQDIAVGPLLVMAKVIGTGGGSLGLDLLVVAGKAAVVIALLVLTARFAVRPALRLVAGLRVPEVFAATALLVVLGSAWATEVAGLSTALGAFLAGLMVADTEFRHQIAADLAPFRGLLLGLFFMTVGMQIDLDLAVRHGPLILLVTLGLVALKGGLLIALALALRYPLRLALQLGGLLAQGSEFTFVLLGLAVTAGSLDSEISGIVTLAVALSMAVAPIGAALGRRIFDRLEGQALSSPSQLDEQTTGISGHVAVIGFGQVGMAVTRHLIGLEIPVLVLDYDPRRVRDSQARNLPVYFGNATRSDVLRAAHLGQARLAVVALPDAEVALRVVTLLHRLYPELGLLVRAHDQESAERLLAAGARAAVLDGLTTALELAERTVVLYER